MRGTVFDKIVYNRLFSNSDLGAFLFKLEKKIDIGMKCAVLSKKRRI